MTAAILLDQVDEVASTSDELIARAMSGATECALMARRQTGGRGRLGRSWATVDGNLFLSVLLRPGLQSSGLQRPGTPPAPGHWSLLAAVALADALDQVLPRPGLLRLKWPNDVLLQGAKVAGILLDAGTTHPHGEPWLVIGFGVNLAAAPHVVGRSVTCVADVAPAPKPEAFAPSLLAHLTYWRRRLATEGFSPVRDAWLARGPVPGDLLAAGTGPDRVEGVFHGLGTDGALLIAAAPGMVSVRSGEVG